MSESRQRGLRYGGTLARMYSCIVVGTDGTTTATRAVEAAFGLASLTGGVVHVVTAWSSLPALSLVGAASAGMAPTPDDGSWVRRLHTEMANIGRGRGLDVRTHAVEDGAAHALLGVAEEVGADVIVVGNRGMTGLRGRLGSVPNTVAHRAACAVLVVPTA